MNEIKLFERWVKRSLKECLWFRNLDEFVIVLDGYTGFRIQKKEKNYLDILKQQTFQDLTRSFTIRYKCITYSEIDDTASQNINDQIEKSLQGIKREKSNLVNSRDNYYLRIYDISSEKPVFIDEEYINYFNCSSAELYSESPISVQVFKKYNTPNIDYFVLPVRVVNFPYLVNKKQEE